MTETKNTSSLNTIDFTLLREVLKSPECANIVIKTIMNRKDLKIIENHTPYEEIIKKNSPILLKVYATDSYDCVYNIHLIMGDEEGNPLYARYYSSMAEAEVDYTENYFPEINQTYTIFINDKDTLGGGEPIYHIESTIEQTGTIIDNGSHIIYINSQVKNSETNICRLMSDLSCTNPDEIFNKVFADRVRSLKCEMWIKNFTNKIQTQERKISYA